MNKVVKILFLFSGCFLISFAVGMLFSQRKDRFVISKGFSNDFNSDCQDFDFEEDENWNENERVK